MIDYYEIAKEINDVLINNCSDKSTRKITSELKKYFGNRFKEHYVAGANNNKEYLYDITVMPCSPLEIYKSKKSEYKIYLVMESELGGKSASSGTLVERNVIEDFFKILQARAQYKIMIGIYSGLNEENDIIQKRINKMDEIFRKSSNKEDVLVVLIKGTNQNRTSNQVQVIKPLIVNGFILSQTKEYEEIQLTTAST